MTQRQVKAAVLLIGDELLSGRTQDVNLQAIAKYLAPLGVQVAEARVVADVPDEIVAAAFGVGIGVRDDARAILMAHYSSSTSLNEARLRMARIPDGASLIANPVSRAPGFQLGNVFVMAGVPSIMRGMLQDVGHRLKGGAIVSSRTVRAKGVGESQISKGLEELETEAGGAVAFGSYPWFTPEGYGVHLVARSADAAALDKAAADLQALIRACGAEPELVEEPTPGP
jgi:molybdopterin-biosynthesis enzyme MoeA-like protein